MARVNVNDRIFSSVQFARLSEEQCRKIHWASLEILERIGVRLHYQAAIDLLKKGGADVEDGNLVYLPSGMVERAFSTVPKRVVLHNRRREPVMPLEGDRCFYGPGSDTLNIIDHRTGERRRPVLKDIEEGAVLCDALPHIDFVMSMVLPTDVDQTIADTYQIAAMLSNTIKPIIIVSYELGGLIDAVEMAEAVMGGESALRRHPLVTCYINVISGLNHNEEALQKLLYLSGKGLPSLYIPSTTGGVSSPITPAGAVALDNAGVLLGLVLSQLNREGAPYIMPGMPPSPMDMRTMTSPYADPDRGIFQALARFYGLPAFGLGGASDSKVVDQQAAVEAALTLLAESLVGGNIIHDLGYLESGLTFSFAQLAICDDIVGWVETFMRGVEVSDETLALDVIKEVGPDGGYLDTKHTLEHFRDIWYPDLFERDTYDVWKSKGGTTLAARAADRVEKILQEYQPEPLPEDVERRLMDIVGRAQGRSRGHV
jgi:trimethylamine--corrinoid protein Co-methyltransferase